MLQILFFIIFTLVLAYISRASLLDRHSHGFYRFFAWEAILAFIILNLPFWFQNWFAWYQVISWFLLVICLIPLIYGVYFLRSRGLPDKKKRSEPSLMLFERTTVLIKTGIFHYIRHPLYCSLLFLNWGVFFKAPSLPGVLLAMTATFLLVLTAKEDESECLKVFGQEYRDYMKTTKRFIPLIL